MKRIFLILLFFVAYCSAIKAIKNEHAILIINLSDSTTIVCDFLSSPQMSFHNDSITLTTNDSIQTETWELGTVSSWSFDLVDKINDPQYNQQEIITLRNNYLSIIPISNDWLLIYDISGKLINKYQLHRNEKSDININYLVSGNYIVKTTHSQLKFAISK